MITTLIRFIPLIAVAAVSITVYPSLSNFHHKARPKPVPMMVQAWEAPEVLYFNDLEYYLVDNDQSSPFAYRPEFTIEGVELRFKKTIWLNQKQIESI